MRRTIILFCIFFLPITAKSVTLSEVFQQFRDRVGERDATTALFDDTVLYTWYNQAQDKIVRLGGYLPRYQDYYYSSDSLAYPLPAAFKDHNGALVWKSPRWVPAYYNPRFQVDTATYQFDVGWKTEDSAYLFLKGNTFAAGDTVRLFYFAIANSLDTTTDTLEVRKEDVPYIVDEMISYWEQSKHFLQNAQAIRQEVRIDLGVLKRE